MVVHDIRVRHVDLLGGPHRIVRREDADLVAVFDAALHESIALSGKGLMRRVSDLARQAESARRIAVGARVALNEDAVKDRVFGVVDPMLVRQLLAADAEMDAADRHVAQAVRSLLNFRWGLVADLANEDRQWHRADEVLVT